MGFNLGVYGGRGGLIGGVGECGCGVMVGFFRRFFCAFSLLFLFEKVANSCYLCIFAGGLLMIIGL